MQPAMPLLDDILACYTNDDGTLLHDAPNAEQLSFVLNKFAELDIEVKWSAAHNYLIKLAIKEESGQYKELKLHFKTSKRTRFSKYRYSGCNEQVINVIEQLSPPVLPEDGGSSSGKVQIGPVVIDAAIGELKLTPMPPPTFTHSEVKIGILVADDPSVAQDEDEDEAEEYATSQERGDRGEDLVFEQLIRDALAGDPTLHTQERTTGQIGLCKEGQECIRFTLMRLQPESIHCEPPYDITILTHADNTQHFVEVKSTDLDLHTKRVVLTENEYAFWKDHQACYTLYRVFNVMSAEPTIREEDLDILSVRMARQKPQSRKRTKQTASALHPESLISEETTTPLPNQPRGFWLTRFLLRLWRTMLGKV